MARRERGKQLRKVIGIVGDGYTEQNYFNEVKYHEKLGHIEIKPELPQNTGDFREVLDKAEELIVQEYDKVFAIIDLDDVIEKELQKEFAKAIQSTPSHLIIIVCNPCFEIWFLLHFEYTTRRFQNCSDLITDKLENHIPNYSKDRDYFSRNNIYISYLRSNLSTAIRNSDRLYTAARKSGSGEHHPNCMVHWIMDELGLN